MSGRGPNRTSRPSSPRPLLPPGRITRRPGSESLPAVNDPTGGGPPSGGPPDTPARIGRYEVRAVLGSGAFGRVYHAFDTELHRDVARALAPVSKEGALELLKRLRSFQLLNGWRGAPRADVDALCDLIARVSLIAAECARAVAELELNHVFVHAAGEGCTIADDRDAGPPAG